MSRLWCSYCFYWPQGSGTTWRKACDSRTAAQTHCYQFWSKAGANTAIWFCKKKNALQTSSPRDSRTKSFSNDSDNFRSKKKSSRSHIFGLINSPFKRQINVMWSMSCSLSPAWVPRDKQDRCETERSSLICYYTNNMMVIASTLFLESHISSPRFTMFCLNTHQNSLNVTLEHKTSHTCHLFGHWDLCIIWKLNI